MFSLFFSHAHYNFGGHRFRWNLNSLQQIEIVVLSERSPDLVVPSKADPSREFPPRCVKG